MKRRLQDLDIEIANPTHSGELRRERPEPGKRWAQRIFRGEGVIIGLYDKDVMKMM